MLAFHNMWTNAPNPLRAIEVLPPQKWRGVLLNGRDRVPHLAPTLPRGRRG